MAGNKEEVVLEQESKEDRSSEDELNKKALIIKATIGFVVVLIIAVGAYFFFSPEDEPVESDSVEESTETNEAVDLDDEDVSFDLEMSEIVDEDIIDPEIDDVIDEEAIDEMGEMAEDLGDASIEPEGDIIDGNEAIDAQEEEVSLEGIIEEAENASSSEQVKIEEEATLQAENLRLKKELSDAKAQKEKTQVKPDLKGYFFSEQDYNQVDPLREKKQKQGLEPKWGEFERAR